MKPYNTGSVFYSPEPVPSNASEIPAYLERELLKIQRTFELLATGHIDVTYVAPPKPREGDFKLADGTSWNPGSGAGFYGYYGSSWVKLG